MKSFFGFVLVGLLLAAGNIQAEEKLTIATSIKPVSMVVKAIAGDKVDITQIVSNTASPHDFALRPSDLKKVMRADLVIWVGESLEPFLEKVLDNSQHKQTAIEWMSLLDGENSHNDGVVEVEHHDEHGHEGHHHDGVDPHVWLDLENAVILADVVTQRLITIQPHQADYFKQNLAAFKLALEQADKDNKALLSTMKSLNYVVFHDAYGYFETHYGIKHLANISLSPERKPGAKKIVAIRSLMKDEKVACIFSEVQFNPAIVNALVENTSVKAIELDPLGARLPLDKMAYINFLKQMGQHFSQC